MGNIVLETVLRSFAAVIIGSLIGSERAKHGRAAGMRTHILVCLGSWMTSMTSMFVANTFLNNGDVFRISAQVISGIGFLGAGMIILKNNNVITGLTTAAGVWTTATIGVALGYGYYIGAITVTVLFLSTIILFAKFEQKRRSAEVLYLEIDNAYKLNEIIKKIEIYITENFTYQIFAAKSGNVNNLGIVIVIDKRIEMDISELLKIENIVFVTKE